MSVAAEVIGIARGENCKVCKMFNESAEMSCGHMVPYTVIEANTVDLLYGSLTLHPGYVNGNKISLLRNSKFTLIGIKKKCSPNRLYR